MCADRTGKVQAYYNENEPFAAEWLRRLIGAGLIAPGHVDERDIQDVRAEDLRGFRQCHFFAGVGTWSHALRRTGWSDDRTVWTGSCPCQPFSCAGKQGGSKDERHLWPEWFRLIRECNPAILLGEQVASTAALAWFDIVSSNLEGEGYAVGAADLCAAGVGAPHIRQRLYWMAHTTPGGQRIDGSTSRQAGHPSQCESIDGISGRVQAEVGVDEERRQDSLGDSGGVLEEDASDQICTVGRMADPRLSECEAGRGVAYPDPGEDRERQDDAGRDEPASCRSDGGRLADADGPGRERQGQAQPEGRERHIVAVGSDPLGGFWAGAEWLRCRDGKARPVRSGSCPLVDGTPSRVGRLRSYGNALYSPQAESFIVAARQILDDGVSSDEEG
jgi:DNA (cytosine-5)-methyltransferase 1